MKKIPISTDKAPAAIGPYTQAIRVGNFIFTSGQIPLDPSTNKLIEGDITQQTKRVMENLKAVLEASGSSLKNVIKTTIFLTDLKNFEHVNKIYGEYFPDGKPARSTVQVSALPKGAGIEIEMVAVAEESV
ncbi:MAG: RidA family protein [Nitrospinae bacterium]|nr:RidA family protein [Nitrospinota bacterium]MBI3815645.1 RidA family protein [Nitrospinota bacterium]